MFRLKDKRPSSSEIKVPSERYNVYYIRAMSPYSPDIADVNIGCPVDRYPKPENCVSELMLIDRDAYR